MKVKWDQNAVDQFRKRITLQITLFDGSDRSVARLVPWSSSAVPGFP